MLKQLLRTSWVQATVGFLLAGYMSLVKHTTRWTVVGREAIEPIWAARQGVIGCVWHSRVLMTIAGWPPSGTAQPASILISRSPDGEFTAAFARWHGIGVIRGGARNPKKPKEKGSIAAFRGMADHVAAGGCVAVTPDGPRGPRMRTGEGPVRLSLATGAPIMAFAASTQARIVFNSWDRLILPLPFSRGVIVWKGPIVPPENSDPAVLEAKRLELETALNDASREADVLTHRAVIEPAPPSTRPTRATALERTA